MTMPLTKFRIEVTGFKRLLPCHSEERSDEESALISIFSALEFKR